LLVQALPMASETISLAVQLVRARRDATNGRPMQWRMIEQLDGATADAAEFAAARGWLRDNSIALTEADRHPAKEGKPRTADRESICASQTDWHALISADRTELRRRIACRRRRSILP
jgi:hypothetical protein